MYHFETIQPITNPSKYETMPYKTYNKQINTLHKVKLSISINVPCHTASVQNTGCWGKPSGATASLPDRLDLQTANINECSSAAVAHDYKYFVFDAGWCYGGKSDAQYGASGPSFCSSQCADSNAGLCGYTYAVNKNEYCMEQQKQQNKANIQDVIETTTFDINLCKYTDPVKLMIAIHKSMYEPLSATDLEAWIDYHTFIGVDRMVIRDRYGDYRNVTQLYQINGSKYNPRVEIVWRPTPIAEPLIQRQHKLQQNNAVVWAVDQPVTVNADVFRYRQSSQWMTSVDVDEYISIVQTNIFQPYCDNTQCSSMLSEFLSDEHFTPDIASMTLYSVFYNNQGDKPTYDHIINSNTLWSNSVVARFPYRKNEVPPYDRVKWIARPHTILHAFQHHIKYNTTFYTHISVTDLTQLKISNIQQNQQIDCSTQIHMCIRTAHFADSYDARLWPLNKFENGANTLDMSLVNIVQYMLQHSTTNSIVIEANKKHPLDRLSSEGNK